MSQPVASVASRTVATDTRNSGQLAIALTDQVSRLVKDEIALATADVKSSATRMAAGGGLLAAAGLLALCGLVALLVAGGLGLAVYFSAWLSGLIMGGAFLLVAGLLAVVGLRSLKKAGSPVPSEALGGLKLDLAVLKQVRP